MIHQFILVYFLVCDETFRVGGGEGGEGYMTTVLEVQDG